MRNKPSVYVLLASYNGCEWIANQVKSIVSQEAVKVSLYISDDVSTDSTKDLVNKIIRSNDNVNLLPLKKSGSAGKNFFRLIEDVNFENSCDYVAFSDQDDIWLSTKLAKAIKTIREQNVDAYSSNVLAFWSDGKEKLIDKAQPQQAYDYMFESAGPGCTFVMTKELACQLQIFLLTNHNDCKDVDLHDWFAYAFARSRGYKWIIDERSYVMYRQHARNVVGANVGVNAKKDRWVKMREGWLRDQALLIAKLLGYDDKAPIKELERYQFFDRLKLVFGARNLRRRARDVFALAIYFIVTPKK